MDNLFSKDKPSSTAGTPLDQDVPALLDAVRNDIRHMITSHTLKDVPINGPPGFSDWMERRIKQIITLDMERETEYLNLRKKDLQLSEIRVCLERYIKCGNCWRLMEAPFSLGCGHSFCVTCLRTAFQTKLAHRLTKFANKMNLNLPTFQHVPSTQQQLAEVLALLKKHGEAPLSFVTYSCLDPECRRPVSKPPVPSYEYRSLVMALKGALITVNNEVVDSGAISTGSWTTGHEDCFGNLFHEDL